MTPEKDCAYYTGTAKEYLEKCRKSPPTWDDMRFIIEVKEGPNRFGVYSIVANDGKTYDCVWSDVLEMFCWPE